VNVHGVEVRKLPDEVIQGLRKLSAEAVNELTKDNEFAQRVAQSIEKFKQQATAYHGISEEAFYKARKQ
jgi:TRAP-type mannitol/chloroaromatic compound transport system substrate-binding protein